MLKFILKLNLLVISIVALIGTAIILSIRYSSNASAEVSHVEVHTIEEMVAQRNHQKLLHDFSDVAKTLNMPEKTAYVDDSSIMSVISSRLDKTKIYRALKNIQLRIGPGNQYPVSQLLAQGQIFQANAILKNDSTSPIDITVDNLSVGNIPNDYGVGWVRLQTSAYASLNEISVYADSVDDLFSENNTSDLKASDSSNSSDVKTSSHENASNFSNEELLKIVESYLPELATKYSVKFSFDADTICDEKNESNDFHGCVQKDDPNTIHLAITPGLENFKELKSLVLHEFSHVVQFNWADTEAGTNTPRYNALYNDFDLEAVADCMAYQLGASTKKPGGYMTRSECENNSKLTAIASGFLNGTLEVAN